MSALLALCAPALDSPQSIRLSRERSRSPGRGERLAISKPRGALLRVHGLLGDCWLLTSADVSCLVKVLWVRPAEEITVIILLFSTHIQILKSSKPLLERIQGVHFGSFISRR